MGDHSSPEDIKKSVRTYMFVFGALLVGTILTVWASYIDLGSATWNITLALIIASVKSFLVAGYFMHLLSEKKVIYATLATTAFFFVGLMGLTLWAMNDFPFFTVVHY